MDLSDSLELIPLGRLAADLKQAAPNCEPLLVGAMARDILLQHGLGVRPARATEDVDLAFAVQNWDEFRSIRETLLATDRFTPARLDYHRLIYQAGLPVDLVPFDGIEEPGGIIVWPEDESVMSVLGYREAFTTAMELTLPGATNLRCVSLPMLGLLKLIAWEDRRLRAPRKDAADFFLILESYLEGRNSERLYTDAADFLETDDFDYESAGAWLAGHDAAASLVRTGSSALQIVKAIDAILAAETDPQGKLRLVGDIAGDTQRRLRLTAAYRTGFQFTIRDDGPRTALS
jgi:predicted nucleotidyltransferase